MPTFSVTVLERPATVMVVALASVKTFRFVMPIEAAFPVPYMFKVVTASEDALIPPATFKVAVFIRPLTPREAALAAPETFRVAVFIRPLTPKEAALAEPGMMVEPSDLNSHLCPPKEYKLFVCKLFVRTKLENIGSPTMLEKFMLESPDPLPEKSSETIVKQLVFP